MENKYHIPFNYDTKSISNEVLLKFNNKMSENINPEYELHIHDDIDLLFEKTNIPDIFKFTAEVYIMQQSRIVFVGNKHNAIKFVLDNRGNFCKSYLPEICLNDGTQLI